MDSLVFGIVAMVGLLVVVGSKYITMAKLQSFHRIVADAEAEIHRVKVELKAAENDKAVAELGLKSEEGKQRALERQVEKNKKELEGLRR